MSVPDNDALVIRPVRLADLANAPLDFDLAPDDEMRSELAARFELLGLRKLRFRGSLRPEGDRDWRLDAELGATVVQPCVVTLAPVTTRLDETVTRRYLPDMPEPEAAAEIEMPEDETAEPLPASVHLGEVMAEALALALPPYPRADGVEAGPQVFSGPGTAPLTDADLRPFAGLADLRDQLKKTEE